MEKREIIIKGYIQAYNDFNVDQMVKNFGDDFDFENIQNGIVNMTLQGKEAFIRQAEAAKNYFLERKQTIVSFNHLPDKSEIEIEYYGVLAMDFPNGMIKGQEIKMKGKSTFEFNQNTIIRLIDES